MPSDVILRNTLNGVLDFQERRLRDDATIVWLTWDRPLGIGRLILTVPDVGNTSRNALTGRPVRSEGTFESPSVGRGASTAIAVNMGGKNVHGWWPQLLL